MPRLRTTHTYAILEISQAAYDEIRGALKAAGYEHTFHEYTDKDGGYEVIDMQGIGIKKEPK